MKYGNYRTANGYNKMLNSYHFFDTEEEAREHIKRKRWRKYVLSSNKEGTCWTLYHKER